MDAVRDRRKLRSELRGQELDGDFIELTSQFQSYRSERDQQLIDEQLRWARIFGLGLRLLSKLHRIDILADMRPERVSLRALFGYDHYHLRAGQADGQVLPEDDHDGDDDRDVDLDVEEKKEKKKKTSTSDNNNGPRRPVYWPLATFYLTVFLIIRLLFRTYFLYQYDLTMLRYKHHKQQQLISINVTAAATTTSLRNDHSTVEEAKFQERFKQLERILTLIGSVTLESRFFVGIFNTYIMLLIAMVSLVGPYVFRFVVRINFPLGKRILDLKLERQAFVRLVCLEINSFIGSMKNFNNISLEELSCSLYGRYIGDAGTSSTNRVVLDAQTKAQLIRGLRVELRAETFRLRGEQKFITRQLRELVLVGAFETSNWRPQQIDRLASKFCLMILSVALNLVVIIVGLQFYLPTLADARLIRGPLALLNRLENGLLLLAGLTGLIYYISIILISILDVIEHLHQLIRLLDECVSLNYWQLQLLAQRRPLVGKAGRQLLEARLLHAYLHYKIYAASFRPIRRMISIFLGFGFALQLILPLLAVLHESYLTEGAKHFYLMVCAFNVLLINSILAPICYMRSRSLDLYRALCSLLAHIIWTDQVRPAGVGGLGAAPGSPPPSPRLYDAHLCWSIRRELADAAMMLGQFAGQAWGVTIDYANLLRLHFWFGLIMLTMLNGRLTRSEVFFGDLFHDPYGLL